MWHGSEFRIFFVSADNPLTKFTFYISLAIPNFSNDCWAFLVLCTKDRAEVQNKKYLQVCLMLVTLKSKVHPQYCFCFCFCFDEVSGFKSGNQTRCRWYFELFMQCSLKNQIKNQLTACLYSDRWVRLIFLMTALELD